MSPKIEMQKELTAENQSVSSFQGAPGGNRTRTAVSGQGIFVPLWLSPPGRRAVPVWGLDYSFTVGPGPLGVSCLVSAPSSCRRFGSRLPSARPGKVSLNLRHSTSLLSESALKLCLSPSCLPFHHQGMGGRSAKGAERTAKIRNNSDNENVGRRYKARLYNKTVPQSRFAVHVSPKPGGMG